MALRTIVGKVLRASIGADRTAQLAVRFPTTRRQDSVGASGSATPQPAPQFARATMSRHSLLACLHDVLAPRTYFEIGVNTGASMKLSKTRSIGVDPALHRVVHEFSDDVLLVPATSDDFFADENALRHFDGVPIDLAFIDGMHLSEFALRDFINVEPLMARTGVVVFDDMLPRNAPEAARSTRTSKWAGDVYKIADVLARNRPDLAVIPVNTSPTGTIVVIGMDAVSGVLDAVYDTELAWCLAPDPQVVSEDVLRRRHAANAQELLALPAWADLVAARDQGDAADLAPILSALVAISRGR